MARRAWFKMWTDIRQMADEHPSVRLIWPYLLAEVAAGDFADQGLLAITETVGYSDRQIAAMLRVPIQQWNRAKQRLVERESIKVTKDNVVGITNWSKYQSDYSRQAHYRKHGLENAVLGARKRVLQGTSKATTLKAEVDSTPAKTASDATTKSYNERLQPQSCFAPPEGVPESLIVTTPHYNQSDNEISRTEKREERREKNTTTTNVVVDGGVGEDPLLEELCHLPQWGRAHPAEDLQWLTEFLSTYPDFTIEDIRACRDYHKCRMAKHSVGQWKARLRNWMRIKYESRKRTTRSLPTSYTKPPRYDDSSAAG